MKKTTKFISAFMAAILCFNLVSFSAFAAEPSATETSFSAADLATYNQELADFGLNDDEIQQLQNIKLTTLIISKKPGNTGKSRDRATEFTTKLLLLE